MDLKWLEDFLSLAETRSFSRAAKLRHVTQSSFSRRIRALENWLGTYLVDRTSSPTNLTPAGEAFKEEARDIIFRMHRLRKVVYGAPASSTDTIHFALTQSLSLSLFPQLLVDIERAVGKLHCRLVSGSLNEMTLAFAEGDCDFLMCYHHPSSPSGLDSGGYEKVTIGRDRLLPCVREVRARTPLFALPGRADAPLPLLMYSPNTYLHAVVERLLVDMPAYVNECHQADTAERLKSMALSGHGVAFLPESTVRAEFTQRLLTLAGDERWQTELEIHLYRKCRTSRPVVEQIWRFFSTSETR